METRLARLPPEVALGLEREACAAMARRSVGNAAVPALFGAIFVALTARGLELAVEGALVAVLAAMTLHRQVLARRVPDAGAPLARWRRAFAANVVATNLAWGILVAIAIAWGGLRIEDTLLVFASASISSAVLHALAPDLRLLHGPPFAAGLPIIGALIAIGTPVAATLAVLAIAQLGFHVLQARGLHAQYWDARIDRAERELSARQLQLVIDAIPDAIVAVAGDEVVVANPAALRLRAAGAELIGLEPGERTLEGGLVVDVSAAIPVTLTGGPATMFVLRDVTERRQLETKLAMSDRMAALGTLAAGLAHEINNPLAYVEGNLQLIRAAATGEELAALARDAEEGAARIRAIVADMRTFSRPQESIQAIDVRGVVRRAAQMTDHQLRHRARVELRLEDAPAVLAAPHRLSQVLVNLLVNAGEAIPLGHAAEHTITVATETDALGRAVISIRDTGAGIPADVLPRIFEPFFTTKGPGGGTGLGLSICHAIVSDLGGDLTIDSEAGAGTTVRVALPAAPRRPLRATPPPPAVALRRARILLIDDEPAITRVLRRLLRAHEVDAVTSAAEGLARIEADAPDVVICDLMMPDMTGVALFEALRARRPELADRVVFMTGGAFTWEMQRFVEDHADRVLAKPFDRARLDAVLQRVLEPRRAA